MRFFLLILAALQLNFLVTAGNTSKTKREKNYCIVREREFSQEFDFTKLSDPDKDYSIEHDTNVILRLQPCGILRNNCNGQEGYAICLNKNGQEIGIGKSPPEIVIEFGEIIFKYTGDKCDKQHNYTVDIKMKCDFGVKEANAGIELYAAGYNDCDYKMEWRTSAACTNPKKINCTVDNKFGHYDLSELTKFSGNYEVFINNKKSVLLNVCHSVIYGSRTCKSNNAACLIDTDDIKSKPIGEPIDNLKYNADGTLSLKYINGALCDSDHTNASTSMETTITFICDLNAIGTLPYYVGGMELCHYQFNWTTAAACSEQALHNKSLEKANSDVCVVKNPITGQIFNLTTLMNKEMSVKFYGSNELYKFCICSPISNTTCKKGTGACKLHKSTSGGIGNSNLMWKESGPYLNYTNGDLCYGNQQRYTVIEFSCGPEDYEIEEENDLCHDVIKFSTPLVCKKQESCSTYNNQVNLRPLMLQLTNYVIKSVDTEYHINLCRSLVKDDKLNVCTDEKASICKVRINNGKVISATSLGSFDAAPVTSSDQSAVIVYHNGSLCEEDKKRRIESSISFFCDINSQMTQPRFKSYSNCMYFFEWKTSLVCGKLDGYFNENCSINNTLGDFRNLSLLLAHNNNSVMGYNNKKYKIAICGNRKDCKGGFICDDNINYGNSISVLYDYAESPDIIRLHFTGGSKCSDGSLAQSILSINCKGKNSSNTPILLKETPCYLEFEWDRMEICRFLHIPETPISEVLTDTKNNIAPNATTSLNGGAITGIIVAILIVVIAIFYLQNESRRTHLIEMISNSTTRNCDRVKYSRVNTMEEVHLLLNESDPTVIDSESDDDELLDA